MEDKHILGIIVAGGILLLGTGIAVVRHITAVPSADSPTPIDQPDQLTRPAVAIVSSAAPALTPKSKPFQLTGGAWIVADDGTSSILRGIEVVLLPQQVKKSVIAEDLRAFRTELDEKIKLDKGPNFDTFYLESAGANISPDEPHAARERRRLAEAELLTDVASTFDREIAPMQDSMPVDVRSLFLMLRRANSGQSIRSTTYGPSNAAVPVNDSGIWQGLKSATSLARTKTSIDGKYSIEIPNAVPCYLFASQQSSGLLLEWLIPIGNAQWGGGSLDLFNKNATHMARH